MKHILTLLLMCGAILLQAENIKVNQKNQFRNYTFNIEKIKVEGGKSTVYLKVKQQKNFSYNISFEDNYITTPSHPEGVKGKLTKWNQDSKVYRTEKPVSDSEFEELTITFPTTEIGYLQDFTLKVGNIQDRNKTEILLTGLKTRKK